MCDVNLRYSKKINFLNCVFYFIFVIMVNKTIYLVFILTKNMH